MSSGRIVVVGASAGGVRALKILASHLPERFPAPLLVVQHIGSHPSVLPTLLMRAGPLPAGHAVDREPLSPGRIYVAPPDHHMMLEGGIIRLGRGAKENHTRPAIDPLFRSAAVSRGPDVIGVLLTGLLDDGTAGMQAIRRCGGTTVVQDPDDAESPSMPLSALRYVDIDHRTPLSEMGRLLASLVEAGHPAAGPAPEDLVHETEILLGKGDFMEHLEAIARPSTFVCPECEGPLWEIRGARPPRFRCHTGHAFTLRTLQEAQAQAADAALWSALRALQEKEILLRRTAQSHADLDATEAARLRDEAEAMARHGAMLRQLIERIPSPPE